MPRNNTERMLDIIKDYADYCESLKAKTEALENPWISCDERLPTDTKAVLAWVPSNKCQYMVTLRPNGEWSSWQGEHRCWWCEFITHWMPLPTPPKGGE